MDTFVAKRSTVLKSIEACKARRINDRSSIDFRSLNILDRVLATGEPDHETLLKHAKK